MIQTNKMKISRLPYYVSSLISLVGAVEIQSLFLKILRFHYPFPMVLEIHSLLDILIAKEVIIDREYESGGVSLERSDRVIVDVGAGFGDFVISTAKRFPTAKIYAYEIDLVYLSLLQKNIQQNNITTIQVINTPVVSIKTLVKTIGKIDFLKIDCEGCEYPLFESVSVKDLQQIRKISMEYHECGEKTKESIVKVLMKAGFDSTVSPLKDIPGTGHITAMKKCS